MNNIIYVTDEIRAKLTSKSDLTNMQFNDWYVMYKSKEKGKWHCRCSCGTERDVLGKSLRLGKSKSCGHNTNKFEDLSGKKINMWNVIEYLGDGMYLCRCDCQPKNGEVHIVSKWDLTSGKSTNCGCVRSQKISDRNSNSRIKLEGTTINDWEVLEYIGDKHYKCKCSCGRIKEVAASDLTSGVSKSCGHNNGKNRIVDISNQRFGKLIAREYVGSKLWRCECDCGNITLVYKQNLLNKSTQSCGCGRTEGVQEEDILIVINKYLKEHNELPFLEDVSEILGKHPGHIRRCIKKYNLNHLLNREFNSKYERELFKLFNNAILHDRTALGGKELDIYIPEKKLAIEFNGDYWHSDLFKDELYHQQKTIECAKKGIHLINIFEYEWKDLNTKTKILAYLNTIINENSLLTIYGRDTYIKEIDKEKSKEFLNNYHIQSSASASIHIGCYYNNELVGVITFGSPRFNKNYQYELIRLCWKPNLIVIGGLNKLFKYFINKYNPTSILSYCDISKFTGNSYLKIGFKPCNNSISSPNYKWVNLSTNTVLNRYQTQKHKLIQYKLGLESQTEDEIMRNLDFLKIYDCGNIKLEWYKKED